MTYRLDMNKPEPLWQQLFDYMLLISPFFLFSVDFFVAIEFSDVPEP